MNEHPVFRSHNLYILGAGFSRDAGLPLIIDFLDQMRDGVDWIAKNGTRAEQEAIGEVFKFRHSAAGAAHRVNIDLENIEELFSLASASERELDNDYVPRAIAATLRYSRSQPRRAAYGVALNDDKFNPPESWEPGEPDAYYRAPVYDVYAGVISGNFCQPVAGMRNTVITFNYDTLLEESLTSLRIPFSYELPLNGADYHPSAMQVGAALMDPSAIRVLKLHGSVNWAMNRVSQTESTVSVYSTYDELLSHAKYPYLLPPTWRKTFAGALASVLTHALDAIRDASRIIIIGSSLPKTDLYFKYLIAGGLKDNISLRDVIVVTLGEHTTLDENVAQLFQENVANRIHWYTLGVQQAFQDGAFLKRIDRSLSPTFGGLQAY